MGEDTFATCNYLVMPKGYWITCYRAVSDPAILARYASLAGPAIQCQGGRFLVRGSPARTYEAGLKERVVIIEFENLQKAIETYESPQYRAALAVLQGSVERDVRFVEGA